MEEENRIWKYPSLEPEDEEPKLQVFNMPAGAGQVQGQL